MSLAISTWLDVLNEFQRISTDPTMSQRTFVGNQQNNKSDRLK